MPCVHLKQLIQLCRENEIRISSSDVVRFACVQCDEKEICPSVLIDEYEEMTPPEPRVSEPTEA